MHWKCTFCIYFTHTYTHKQNITAFCKNIILPVLLWQKLFFYKKNPNSFWAFLSLCWLLHKINNGNKVAKDKQKTQVKCASRWTPLFYFNTSWKTIKSHSKVRFSTDDLSDSLTITIKWRGQRSHKCLLDQWAEMHKYSKELSISHRECYTVNYSMTQNPKIRRRSKGMTLVIFKSFKKIFVFKLLQLTKRMLFTICFLMWQ